LIMLAAVGAPAAPALPTYSDTFVVHTLEMDDTHGTVSVRQTIAVDPGKQRSHMTADGAMVQGHLEQIRRCDFSPSGYGIQINGGTGSAPSTWMCTNTTINPSPADCQWNPFWTLPDNTSYVGTATINGTDCNRWEYWMDNERYNFFGTDNSPLRIAKVEVMPNTQHVLWHIDFIGYTPYNSGSADMVPLSYFAVPKGVDCPPSTPPLQIGGSEAVLASSSTRTAAVAAVARHYLHDQFAVNQQYKKVMQQPQPQSQHQLQVHVSAAVDADACVAGKNITFGGTEFETKYLVVNAAPAGSPSVQTPLSSVSATVVGALSNGTVFWNSSNPPVSPGGLFTYTFDAAPRQLIVGFDVGSYGMAVGETRVLCIPPAEGYGNKDRKDGSGNVIIPANSTLLFTLTCAKISAPATTAQAL